MMILKKWALAVRHFKSWQYRKANYMYYCNDCESYSRVYQIELKKLTCKNYKEAQCKQKHKPSYLQPDFCPHCLSFNLKIIGHNDIKDSRKAWLDYDLKAPKLELKQFVEYQETIKQVNENIKSVKEIEHFLKHNKLVS